MTTTAKKPSQIPSLLNFHMAVWKARITANYIAIGGHRPEELLTVEPASSTPPYQTTMYAKSYIKYIEEGRGPRLSAASSGLSDRIYDWMARKGLFKSYVAKERMQEAKRLTWLINQHGTRLWQSLGNKGSKKRMIYSNVLTQQAINELIKKLGDTRTHEISSEIISNFE
jgi:hypothetical protein